MTAETMTGECLSAFATFVMAAGKWQPMTELTTDCVSMAANVVMALAAAAGLILAYNTIRQSQATQREATAKELWHNYEKMAFDNRIFASPLPREPLEAWLRSRTQGRPQRRISPMLSPGKSAT